MITGTAPYHARGVLGNDCPTLNVESATRDACAPIANLAPTGQVVETGTPSCIVFTDK